MTGIERSEREAGDTARAIASAALFVPRAAVDLVFTATGTAASLIEEEQVIPRIDELLNPPPGEIHVFPTAFVETGSSANVGVRAIGRAQRFASSVRAGYGGPNDLVAESRLRFSTPAPLPLGLGVEALHDARSSLGYLGLGQNPETDPRNAFVSPLGARSATYAERRERFIASGGLRFLSDFELLLSTSYARRHVLDPPDGSPGLEEVFAPGSVPGAGEIVRVVYSELALRADTRATRGGPASGFLLEGYAGRGDGRNGESFGYARAGGRGALFIPVLERSNILSPALAIDGLSPRDGAVPFIELPRQPDFRGFDNRRDYTSVVASLDYRWTLMRYLAARLFADGATVAPRLEDLDPNDLRVAGGFGLDVFSRSTQLGSIAGSFSEDGFRFFFRFGVSSGFGDRQHRS